MSMSAREHAYHYRLTEEAEDALLKKKEARKMLTDKTLCAEHNISRSTLRQALQRALIRRKSQTTEQND
jgi:DNA-binding GntR family transcriptional regulator